MAAPSLNDLFRAAATLTGPSGSPSEARPSDLKGVLRRRLAEYDALLGKDVARDDTDLEMLQHRTALEALSLLELLHDRLKAQERQESATATAESTEGGPASVQPLVGTRDMGLIRTLLSILFKWAVEPLLQRIVAAIPSTSTSKAIARASIIDLTGLPHDFSTISSIASRLLALVLPRGAGAPISHSAVTAALLNRQLPDLVVPCIVVGWLPKSLASDSIRTADEVRPLVMHLISRLPAAHVISAIGLGLSSTASSLPYVRKTCTFILSRQLLRPEGIRGLCESVFGEEEASGEDVALDKLEHVSRLLGTIPAGMAPQEYLGIVLPRMLMLLSLEDRALPHAYRRAIAFSLSRMLTNEENAQLKENTMNLVFPMLHDPIVNGAGNMSPKASLNTIQVLLTNTDPSPHLITALLTPIVPSLYSLYACLEGAKAADPILREGIKGLLSTWGRLVSSEDVIGTIWQIINGEGSDWRVDVAGEISRVEGESGSDGQPLSLFTPESLKEAEAAGEFDVDSNLLGLKPDPVRLVRFLKTLDRSDVSSDLFVQLLEAYRDSRTQKDPDPVKTLLYLQLVLQIQKQLSTDDASSVLKKPEHILTFVKHALENPRQSARNFAKQSSSNPGLRMEDLRIVSDDESEDESEDEEGDSDDEDGDQEHGSDDMTTTAVKLLLSVLEANPDLSARTAPVLNDIFSLLEPLSKAPQEDLRGLAREARMVMTARLASTSGSNTQRPSKSASGEEDPRETYQKALKLLQDQLLPVRAHGLMLLRQLVSARRDASGQLVGPAIEPALVPGVLSIFMQSVQDDDSYMFLNAVQGLAAMVDGFGKDVLRNLVNVYSEGLDGLSASAMSQHDVDMRTRVGEALGQVIRRCGEALPSYAAILIPPLFRVIRASHFPTVLRTSAVSLLAQCVKTNALAVLPYAIELSDAMIDLLQVESVAATQRKPSPRSDVEAEADAKDGAEETAAQPPGTMDSQPTSTNSKFPPLRRAALHFLTLLTNACTARVYETGHADGLLFPPGILKRAKTTLGYIAAMDADDVVRVMAREAVEGLDQLAEAIVGL
ncbi:hypothetical protein GY45DRAFT_69015 [Cubamyces sp. BRFM 1775]|nr:hypothetical protein GY45DRAFT_69015 [Cubamyces sp. BRFM 1775]